MVRSTLLGKFPNNHPEGAKESRVRSSTVRGRRSGMPGILSPVRRRPVTARAERSIRSGRLVLSGAWARWQAASPPWAFRRLEWTDAEAITVPGHRPAAREALGYSFKPSGYRL